MKKTSNRQLAGLLLLMSGSALAQTASGTLADCAAIADNMRRLACYDGLAASTRDHSSLEPWTTPEPLGTGIISPAPALPSEFAQALEVATVTEKEPESILARHWETEQRYRRGRYRFRPHRDNYILFAKYDNDPNNTPFEPFRSLTPEQESLNRTELAFQFGFKMKLAETIGGSNTDLWFGYTQKSFWQAYSERASSPFRETNYQPEVMLVTPLNFSLLGLRARFVNLGFTHQSNGQSSTLSRSWNRLYVQAGWERGDFSLLTRAWTRVDEGDTPDDNPRIIDYMGHGDIVATWRRNGHIVSLLARRNFSTDKGAIQLGWAFPVVTQLKGYVQVFSGYGQSLIDYNSHQNAVGLGVLLDY